MSFVTLGQSQPFGIVYAHWLSLAIAVFIVTREVCCFSSVTPVYKKKNVNNYQFGDGGDDSVEVYVTTLSYSSLVAIFSSL